MSGTSEPSVFISYAHADKELAHAFANGLEAEGLKTWVDENELLPGDSIIEQVSTAVQGVDYFCALVSQASRESRWCKKELSLAMTRGLGREGSTVMPLKVGDVEMPHSLQDVLYVELDPDDVAPAVRRIADGVRRHRERRDESGDTAATQNGENAPAPPRSAASAAPGPVVTNEHEPITIVGVVKEGVGKPRNDGTRGSGLYRIPLRLSRRPSAVWSELFARTWDHPPRYTTMHRPGIGTVQGDTIVLDGTTMDELEQYHVETLRGVIEKVNREAAEIEAREAARQAQAQAQARAHDDEVEGIADRLRFD